MARSASYDEDIAKMYGTAKPRPLYEVVGPGPDLQYTGEYGYAYYPATTNELQSLIDSLFGNGEQGVMYIPEPKVLGQQVLWQDVEGTVPVMSDGDPVGLMLDLSGNGNHASQETSAARPVYRYQGGLHYLQMDGVDDSLVVPDYVIGQNSYPDGTMLSAAIEYTGAGIRFNVLGSLEGSYRRYYIATGPSISGNQIQFGMGSTFEAAGYEFTKGRAFIAGMGWESGEFVGREDGGEVVRESSSWGSEGGTLYLGTVPNNRRGERHFNGRFYGVAIRDEYDSTNGASLAKTEQYLANLAGVTL